MGVALGGGGVGAGRILTWRVISCYDATMDNETLYQDTFRHLREAEYNECYYRERSAVYAQRDVVVRIATAVFSSAAVVAVVGGTWWGSALSIVTFAMTAANTVLGYGDRARTRGELAAKWSEVAGRLHDLDIRVRAGKARPVDLRRVVERAEALQGEDKEAVHAPTAARAHQQVTLRWSDRMPVLAQGSTLG